LKGLFYSKSLNGIRSINEIQHATEVVFCFCIERVTNMSLDIKIKKYHLMNLWERKDGMVSKEKQEKF
jgi:hypothetical protein